VIQLSTIKAGANIMGASAGREISLGDDFGEVILKANSARCKHTHMFANPGEPVKLQPW
jgi:hypothetical protein